MTVPATVLATSFFGYQVNANVSLSGFVVGVDQRSGRRFQGSGRASQIRCKATSTPSNRPYLADRTGRPGPRAQTPSDSVARGPSARIRTKKRLSGDTGLSRSSPRRGVRPVDQSVLVIGPLRPIPGQLPFERLRLADPGLPRIEVVSGAITGGVNQGSAVPDRIPQPSVQPAVAEGFEPPDGVSRLSLSRRVH